MKQIVFLGLALFLLTLRMYAEEDFDSFDDEEMSFVIKTKKPKIVVQSDSSQKSNTVTFTNEAVGNNEAITMRIKNFVVFDKLKSVDADYIVLDVALKNIMPPQKVIVSHGANHPSSWVNKSSDDYEYKEAIPMYQIPDVVQHLYLSVNNGKEKSIDIMTLLLEKPLIAYNSNIVEVYPEVEKEGRLAFRLPKDTEIKQLSLHYYDTKYGNMDIPIVGEMKQKTVDVTQLSTKAYAKMNENFEVAVTGYDVKEYIGTHKAKKDGQFEVVEIDFQSKVYALLQLNPSKRFYLKVGDAYRLKLHPITQELPMGLYSSASLSPGANNKFRLVFYVPKGMEKLSRSLMVELKGDDIVLPIKKGEDGIGKQVLAKGSVEGTSLEVNGVYVHDSKLLIDLTFTDEKDAYSTRLHDAFYLNEKPEMPNISSRKMVRSLDGDDIKQSSGMGSFTHNTYNAMYAWYPLSKSSDKVFEYQKQETILDGNKKRVFLWFDNQFSNTHTKPWYLVSPIFQDLKFKIDKVPESLPKALSYALVKSYPYTPKKDRVDTKVLAMVKKFRAQKSKEEKNHSSQEIVRLESTKEKSKFVTIPAMSASDYGQDKLAQIKTVEALIVEMTQLTWVPSAYDVTTAIYSTSAIFTQGWASENEMFKAVYNMVKDKDVKFGSYSLSDEGKKVLQKQAKNIPMNKSIPFVEWQKNGQVHSLVFPFLKPISEVQSYVTKKQYLKHIKQEQASIEMKLTYLPKNDGTATKSFGMFGGALGGATTTEKTDVIFKKSWNIDEISDTPVDVYFPATTAFYTEGNKTLQDNAHALAEKKVEPKALTINITMPDGKLDTYEHHFHKKEELKDVFFTFALGTPDIPISVINEMEERRKMMFKGHAHKKINPFSKLQWLNRAKIYKFTSVQTANEKRLEHILKVQAKRNKSTRCIMTFVEKTVDKKLRNAIDLRRVFNDVYGEDNKSKSFNIMSGMFNAEAEAGIIPKGRGAVSLWNMGTTKLMILPLKNKEKVVEWMKRNTISKDIQKRYSHSEKVWIFPRKIFSNLAWLEVDFNTYQTVSVLSNGLYGAAETAELEFEANIENMFLGFFAGVMSSEFAVNAYSLVYMDYCSILKAAENFVSMVGCALSLGEFMRDPSTVAAVPTAEGCAGSTEAATIHNTEIGLFGGKHGLGDSLGGFANGYGYGTYLYFKEAKSSGGCQ